MFTVADCPTALELLRKHRNNAYEANRQLHSLMGKLSQIQPTNFESDLLHKQGLPLCDAANAAGSVFMQLDKIIEAFERADRR